MTYKKINKVQHNSQIIGDPSQRLNKHSQRQKAKSVPQMNFKKKQT